MVALERIANFDRQYKLISAEYSDENEIFVVQYKKGPRQGHLKWLQLDGDKINSLGDLASSPTSTALRDLNGNLVLKDQNIMTNPLPECEIPITGATKYDCLTCQSSKNPFCSGFEGNKCSSTGNRECSAILPYRNQQKVYRKGFITTANRVLLLEVWLSLDDSSFVAKVPQQSQLKHKWNEEITDSRFKISQTISEDTDICNRQQTVYLTSWFTTDGSKANLVSEEEFLVINSCEDLRADAPPPPPNAPSTIVLRTLEPNTTSMALESTESSTDEPTTDVLSTSGDSTTHTPDPVTVTSLVSQNSTPMVATLTEASSSLPVAVIVIVAVILSSSIGCIIGYCLGQRKTR